MVDFKSILLIQSAPANSGGDLPQETGDDYTALIFYVVGAVAAFYFYVKLKKKR